jgi:hypothetical protein
MKAIGFFFCLRKYKNAVLYSILQLFVLPIILLGATPVFAEEEVGQIYYDRDDQGNRIFGTDSDAAAPFKQDKANGDLIFKTEPPKPAQGEANDLSAPQHIFVTPELKPGRPR